MPRIVVRPATVPPIPFRLIALLCAALLACPTGTFAAARQNVPPAVWEALQTAAPGTEVEVTLTSGAKVRGRLVDAGSDAVRLNANEVLSGSVVTAANTALSETQTFRRSDVVTAKIIGQRSRPSYRSSNGTPDAATVRRVVTALGVGRTVNLKTTTARRIRTRILSIEDQSFTIPGAGATSRAAVSYGEVMELDPAGVHPGVKAATAAAALGGLIVMAWALRSTS